MFDSEVISLVGALTVVGEVTGVDCLVDLRRLEPDGWNLDEEEEFVEDVPLVASNVATELVLNAVEDRLDRIAVSVTCLLHG